LFWRQKNQETKKSGDKQKLGGRLAPVWRVSR
jgi:hypothetical protein